MLKLFIGFMIGMTSLLHAENDRYLHVRKLPEDSLLKMYCEQAPISIFIKSDVESACELLEKILEIGTKKYTHTEYWKGLHLEYKGQEGMLEDIKKSVRVVLRDQPDKIKWQEHNKFMALDNELEKKRIEEELENPKF